MSTMTTSEGNWLLQFTGVTSTPSSHILATTNTFIDKDIRITAVANAGDYSADSSSSTNSTVTPKINLHASAVNTYGFITQLPSGVTATDGTNYLILDPDATATNWSVTPRAKITAAGYLAVANKNGTAVSQKPTIAAGTNYYVPIVSIVKDTNNAGALTTATNTNEITTPPTVTLSSTGTFKNGTDYGVTSTQPANLTDGTDYLTIDGTYTRTSGTATSTVKVNRAAVKYTNEAGVIAAHSTATELVAATNTGNITQSATITVNVTDNFSPLYIPIVSGITLSGGGLTNTKSNEITTVPKVKVTSSGTFKSASTYGVTTTKPSGTDGTNYLTINDSTTVETTGKATATVKVTRAAITYTNAAGAIVAHSGTASNLGQTDTGNLTAEVNITPTINDQFAALYIPIRQVVYTTTTIGSNNAVTRGQAKISAGAIAATTLDTATFANSATSGQSYTDISETSAAPVLTAGGYLYINKGYTDNLRISLAKLVPDSISNLAIATSQWIHPDYGAFGADGQEIRGSMTIYDGTYT